MTVLHRLLDKVAGPQIRRDLCKNIAVAPKTLHTAGDDVSREVLAQAFTMLLFAENIRTVSAAKQFVEDHRPIIFDHGAVRTIDGPTGGLPAGRKAIERILAPLGFECVGTYPLDRLKMSGFAFAHRDLPYDIAQFFVSELHVDRLTTGARLATGRIFGSSNDPLGSAAEGLLRRLEKRGELEFDDAARLLPVIVNAFGRQHGRVNLADYELLLEESAEAAWIATEGNCFNHATARVEDVLQLAERLKRRGYRMKQVVEVSREGTVKQTACEAELVEREFDTQQGPILRWVPGSFFEWITRYPVATPDGPQIDLRFDSGNAQGIFKMTAAQTSKVA